MGFEMHTHLLYIVFSFSWSFGTAWIWISRISACKTISKNK